MGKKDADKLKHEMAKQLEDVCLHCAFFKMHQDKWMGWSPGQDDDGKAFNDLVHSAIKIVAEIFTWIDEADQMKFFQNVNSQRPIKH